MKYLCNYIEDAQTKAFKEAGSFFAFSNKQFEEQHKKGIRYMDLGCGLFCPVKNAETLLNKLDNIAKAGIKQDIKENTIKGVIIRELANHEAYYTGDITSTLDALEDYKVTRNQVIEVYNERRNDHAND